MKLTAPEDGGKVTRPPRGGSCVSALVSRTAHVHAVMLASAIQMLVALLVLLNPTSARASEPANVVAHYQFFREDPAYIEDYLRFDTLATVYDGMIQAQVNPYTDAFTLREGDVSWRVMCNFSGGTDAGERDVTADARYDATTGMLTLSQRYAADPISFVAQLPWEHPAHELVDHWRHDETTGYHARAAGVRALRPLVIGALASAQGITAGAVFPIKNVVSGPTGSVKPSMLGCDYGVRNMATLCGHPEREGSYGFFVAFQKDNCELFELAGAVPGTVGGSGTYISSEGDVVPLDARDRQWVVADCVEEVNNGIEIFHILEDAGSWVRVDAIEGAVMHCTFRLSVNGPNGVNYQDVMGKFDLDMPYGGIRLQKRSSYATITDGNDCYGLSGARYEVFTNEDCTQRVGTLVCDDTGKAELHDLRAGSYWVREADAPKGFALDSTALSVEVRAGEIANVGGGDVFDVPLYAAMGLTVQKVDAEGAAVAQGDATLTGASIEISYYDGLFDRATALPSAARRTWILTTAELDDGIVGVRLGDPRCQMTGDAAYELGGVAVLPLGTVAVREIGAPTGYLLTDNTVHLLQVIADDSAPGGATIRKVGDWDGTIAHTDALDLAICDRVARGGVRLGKIDAENGRHLAQGAATLGGAVMAIELASEGPVIVDGTTHTKGDVVKTVTLDGDGTGATPPNSLPFGTYVAYELTAPRGYLVRERDVWSRSFRIEAEGVMVDLSSIDDSVPDQVIRGDLDLTKVDGRTMEHLGGVPFVIVSDTTGEAHVIVTDGNGYANTAATWSAHSHATNANDDAVEKVGRSWVVKDGRTLDAGAGLWFSGRIDADVPVDDMLGALPYDSYTLIELATSANEGLTPVSFGIKIDREGVTVAGGTVANHPAPTISTTLIAEDTGTHMTGTGRNVVLKDNVTYSSLDVGARYELTGTLHLLGPDGTDGGVLEDSTGSPIMAHASFVASQQSGSVTVAFTLDASTLGGRSVVAFETLARGDATVAAHEDLDDEAQTVSFASITTALSDDATGGKLVSADKAACVIDAVHYRGLVPGTSYRLVGTLMDRSTGEPAISGDGKAITGSSIFVPELPDGSVDVRFDFDASAQSGHTLVAYQALYDGDTELLVHADIDNVAQTVTVPHIETVARDSVTGTHEALAAGNVVIIDTVSYDNLVSGETYELATTIVASGTGNALLGSREEPVARSSFVAETSGGSIEMAIPVDASKLGGNRVTVCEFLYHDGRLLASHDDPTSVEQSIAFPLVVTEATDPKTGSHEVVASGEVNIRDTVTYRGLTPGARYTATATLHRRLGNGDDGGVIHDGNDHEAAAETTFVPDAPDGMAKVDLVLDASDLAGETLVVFEQVADDRGNVVAEHADIASNEQAVIAVAPKEPPASTDGLPRTSDLGPHPLPVVMFALATMLLGIVGVSLSHTPTSLRKHVRQKSPGPLNGSRRGDSLALDRSASSAPCLRQRHR